MSSSTPHLDFGRLDPYRFQQLVAAIVSWDHQETQPGPIGPDQGFDIRCEDGTHVANYACKFAWPTSKSRSRIREWAKVEGPKAFKNHLSKLFLVTNIVVNRAAEKDFRQAVRRFDKRKRKVTVAVWDRETLRTKLLHLPHIREWFLLGNAQVLLHPPDRYLNEFLASRDLHDAPLVGRGDELTKLLDFVRGDRRAMVMSGSPGVGKTRLGLELAKALAKERHPMRPFFVRWISGKDPARELARFEDQSGYVLIVDDAEQYVWDSSGHGFVDLRCLIELARPLEAEFNVKIVLLAQQAALSKLEALLAPLGSWVGPTMRLDALARATVENLLRRRFQLPPDELRELAHLTGGLPFLATRAEKMWNHDEDILQTLMAALDPLRQSHPETADLLPRLAALSPIPIHGRPGASILDLVAEELRLPVARLWDVVTALEKASIVSTAGRCVRIVPPYFGWVVLASALRDSSGGPAPLWRILFERYFGHVPEALIRNLAHADSLIPGVGVLDPLLTHVASRIQASSGTDLAALGRFARMASFRPEWALGVAERTLRTLTSVQPGQRDTVLSTVLDGVAAAARSFEPSGQRLDRVARAFRLATELTESTPEKSRQILGEFVQHNVARYRRPYADHARTVIEAVDRSSEASRRVAVRALTGLLEVVVPYRFSEAATLTFGCFALPVDDDLRKERERAVAELAGMLGSSSGTVMLEAMAAIRDVGRHASPPPTLPPAIQELRLMESRRIADVLAHRLPAETDWPVRAEIEDQLFQWYASGDDDLAGIAGQGLGAAVPSQEYLLYRRIFRRSSSVYALLHPLPDHASFQDRRTFVHNADDLTRNEIEQTVSASLEAFSQPEELRRFVEKALSISPADESTRVLGQWLTRIAATSSSHGCALLASPALERHAARLLSGLKAADPDRIRALVRENLRTVKGPQDLADCVAALSSDPIGIEDLELFRNCARLANDQISQGSGAAWESVWPWLLGSAEKLAQEFRTDIEAILLSWINSTPCTAMARDLAWRLTPGSNGPLALLEPVLREPFLDMLREMPDLEHFGKVSHYLEEVAARDPLRVFDWLEHRVCSPTAKTHGVGLDRSALEHLAAAWSASPFYGDLVRRVRDWMLRPGILQNNVIEVFSSLGRPGQHTFDPESGPLPGEVRDAISEWLRFGDPALLVYAMDLLSSLGWGEDLCEIGVVALAKADQLGLDFFDKIAFRFKSGLHKGVTSRAMGKPDATNLMRIARLEHLADAAPGGRVGSFLRTLIADERKLEEQKVADDEALLNALD